MEYLDIVDMYDKLNSTTKRLEKTKILSEFLRKVDKKNIEETVLILQGKLSPSNTLKKMGVSSKLIIKAIEIASGISASKIEQRWKELGDLGDVASDLMKNKKQSTLFSDSLTAKKVISNLTKIANAEGPGSVGHKINFTAELLSSSKEKEATYIVRTILEDLRVGVKDGTMRDAICWAFFYDELGIQYDDEKKAIEVEDREKYNEIVGIVQTAIDLTNNLGEVAKIASEEGISALKKIELRVGIPIKVMLGPKAKNIDDALKTVGVPAQLEYKYDGFRMQIHKKKESVRIFTRRLEEVTDQFPEVRDLVLNNIKGKEFVIDSEAVAYDKKTMKYLPFQTVSQRIRRKYDIEKLSEKYPVELNIFDIMFLDGKSLINTTFKERREIIETIVNIKPNMISLAKKKVVENAEAVEEFYKESLSKGNEGLMIKSLSAPYKPGARVGYMVKLKPKMEPVDLVIVKAEWGEGKRANFLSSFTLACVDDGEFLEIGKVGTGIKEKSEGVSFKDLTELLAPLIIEEKGKEVRVKPKIVIQIDYEEIQKSPNYSSGYALRFPRLARIREDRSAEDATSKDFIEELYFSQKAR